MNYIEFVQGEELDHKAIHDFNNEEYYQPTWKCLDCNTEFMTESDKPAYFCPCCGTRFKEVKEVNY